MADSLSEIKEANEVALGITIAAFTRAAAMWWNSFGWAAGVVALSAGSALTYAVAFLIVALGASVLWALWNDWKVIAKGKVKLPDGSEIKGGIILSPN